MTYATNLLLPHQDTSRDNIVKVRKLCFAIFSIFLIVCTLDFQAGNFTCILRMKSFEDISCKRLLLQGKDLKNARRRLWKKLERFNRAQKSLFENRK